MKKTEVLEQLKLPGRELNRKILEEIQNSPSQYKDELLDILTKEADNPQNPASTVEYNHWLYAMYLLAEFRDKRAYLPIIKLFTRPGNFLNPLTGDIVLQNLAQILASVAHGEIRPIKDMIENTNLNEYCRGAGIEALVIMVEKKELEREELYHYFALLFKTLERNPIFPWTILAQSAILLYKKSFLKEVKQAFQSELIDEIYLDMDEVKSYLSDPDLSSLALAKKKHGIIIDAVSALDWWVNLKEPSLDKTYKEDI